jgi:Aspartyl protease
VSAKIIVGLVVALIGTLVLLPAAGGAACVVDNKTTIALQVVGGSIVLPVEVNGISAPFVLDTGAERSVVTGEAAQRLGLARDQWVGTTMGGIGGVDRRPNADPRSLSLGGVVLTRRTLNHDRSLTVGVLPGISGRDSAIAGLLGRDYLALFDLDLDLPARRLTLYQVSGCAGRFLPWTAQYASVPFTTPPGEAVILPVTIDGSVLRAMLDSGATSSLVAAPGMYKLGLAQASLSDDPSSVISGLGTRSVTVHRHQFAALTVGNQTIASPSLWVEPIRLSPIVDMLLGADWLAQRRVWISFATKQLLVAD